MASTVSKLADKKVGQINLLDGALIAGSKLASEMAMSKIGIGDGTIKSGLIKSGVAVAGQMILGNKRSLQIVYTGILIDGMEDIVIGIKNRYLGGMSSSTQNEGEVSVFGN